MRGAVPGGKCERCLREGRMPGSGKVPDLRSRVPPRVRGLVRAGEARLRAQVMSRRRGQVRGSLPPYCLEPMLRSLTRGSRSILDVGCGRMERLSAARARVRVGIDAHRPYLAHRVADDL